MDLSPLRFIRFERTPYGLNRYNPEPTQEYRCLFSDREMAEAGDRHCCRAVSEFHAAGLEFDWVFANLPIGRPTAWPVSNTPLQFESRHDFLGQSDAESLPVLPVRLFRKPPGTLGGSSGTGDLRGHARPLRENWRPCPVDYPLVARDQRSRAATEKERR